MKPWKQLGRKTIYDTKFLKLWEDTVDVGDGHVFDDYSVVGFPDSVVIVATDKKGDILMFEEYKYAINETILSFPAGSIEDGQTPEQAALRELKEETGYESDEVEVIGESRDYPSKIKHTDYIVRIKNAREVSDTDHEKTEAIGKLQLISPDDITKLWQSGKFKAAYMTSALAHSFPERLKT